jgi:hypothetical protein
MRHGYKAVSGLLRTAGVCGLLLAVAAPRSSAQVILPPIGGGLPRPGATGRWGMAFTLQETWIRATGLGLEDLDTQDRYVSDLQLTLSHNRKLGRGQFSISGGGLALRDHLADENILTYMGDIGFNQPMSRNLSVHLRGRTNYTYAQQLQLLTDTGLVLPLELTRTNSGEGGLSLRLSPKVTLNSDARYDDISYRVRDTAVSVLSFGGGLGIAFSLKTHLNFDGHYDQVRFDQSRAGTTFGSGFDGNNITAGTSFIHQYTQTQGFSLRYGFARTRVLVNRDAYIHSSSAGWNWAVSPKVTLNLGAGASYYELETEVPSVNITGWTPNADAGLILRFRDQGTLNLRYQRAIQPVYGYGQNVTADYFSAVYNRMFGRRFLANTSASYGNRHGINDKTFELKTKIVAANLRYALSRRFDVAGGYEYRNNNRPGPFTRTTTHVGTASLTYGYDWR